MTLAHFNGPTRQENIISYSLLQAIANLYVQVTKKKKNTLTRQLVITPITPEHVYKIKEQQQQQKRDIGG